MGKLGSNPTCISVLTMLVFAGVYAAVEGHTYFRDFLPSALKDGRYRAMPDPYVVGDGLHGIQTGLEVLGNGVSAKKVVVTMNNGT